MQNIVNTIFDGLSVERRGQRRIDQCLDAAPLADFRETLQVDDAEMRIRGRFTHEQPRMLVDGCFHRRIVTRLDLASYDAESRQVFRAEFAAAVITLVEKNHL